MLQIWETRPKSLILSPLLLVLLLIVACGSASPPEAPADTQSQQPADTQTQTTAMPQATSAPQMVETQLNRVSVAVAPLGWDTNYNYKVTSSGLLDKRPVMEYLVGVDPNTSEYYPMLAESWQMAPNGKDWTFKLRQGIQFHDGFGEVTAKDVRHSFFILVQPTSAASTINNWRRLTGVVKDDSEEVVTAKLEKMVEIVDDYTVIVHSGIVQPDMDFFVSEDRNMPIESKARWDQVGDEGMGDDVIGTGPFTFRERVEGVHVILDAVEDHWRSPPKFKEFEFRWVQESATRLAALLTEEVQMSDIERAVRQEALARGMTVFTSKFPAMTHKWWFGGQWHAEPGKLLPDNPLNNVKVRQALNKAVNRKAIAESLLPGSEVELKSLYGWHPVLNKDQFNPKWFDEEWDELYGYDPVAAKQLLVDAGYPNGFELTIDLFTQPGLPEMVDIGQVMALDFEAIGVTPVLNSTEYTQIRGKYRAQTTAVEIYPSRSSARPILAVPVWYLTGGTGSGYATPAIDALQAELDQTLDVKERNRILMEIGDHVFREFATLSVFAIKAEIAANPKFISNYTYPGTITGYFTHLDQIELAQ